jgi:hypothetical protein
MEMLMRGSLIPLTLRALPLRAATDTIIIVTTIISQSNNSHPIISQCMQYQRRV